MRVICPPEEIYSGSVKRPSVFLAGTHIDGAGEEWQKRVIHDLKNFTGSIFNPRCDDWDAS